MILITGGLGYIGASTCYYLLKSGYELIIIDNVLTTDNALSTDNLNYLTSISNNLKFYNYDITNYEHVYKVFSENRIESVIHFAGLKSVPESIKNPLIYYDNNVNGTITLLKVMDHFKCKKLIFSSSACVYGNKLQSPYNEDVDISLNDIPNPYGKTKYIVENILKDYCVANKDFSCIILRYFNPIGFIEKIKSPNKEISNLMDVILDSISNNKKFYVFGNDYETRDGSCIRDFIHIYDLVNGHIKALEYEMKGYEIFNLGTGNGVTVLELISLIEKKHNIKLLYEISERRIGDIPVSISNIDKSIELLKWKPERNIVD
jgi:UDP-glucose 4-epimerase